MGDIGSEAGSEDEEAKLLKKVCMSTAYTHTERRGNNLDVEGT